MVLILTCVYSQLLYSTEHRKTSMFTKVEQTQAQNSVLKQLVMDLLLWIHMKLKPVAS